MLAREKSAKSAALAELDVLQNKEPDSSEADVLRKELELRQIKHNSELAALKTDLEVAHAESGSISHAHAATALALEKALADLDGRNTVEASASEADTLRTELRLLKEEHESALVIAQQTARQATSEHLAAKSALEKAEADAATSQKTFQADYNDLNESMTQLLEEASAKAKSYEAQLQEVEAQLKIKDDEIAVEKVLLCPQMVSKAIREIRLR